MKTQYLKIANMLIKSYGMPNLFDAMNSYEDWKREDLAFRGPVGIVPTHKMLTETRNLDRSVEDIKDYNLNWLPFDDPERDRFRRHKKEKFWDEIVDTHKPHDLVGPHHGELWQNTGVDNI